MESIANEIKRIVSKHAPSAEVYLYGSRAKGTEHPTSDWDVLILVPQNTVTQALEEKITSPLYDLEFDTGEIISPMVCSVKEWNTKYSITPFYRTIMKERKRLLVTTYLKTILIIG